MHRAGFALPNFVRELAAPLDGDRPLGRDVEHVAAALGRVVAAGSAGH